MEKSPRKTGGHKNNGTVEGSRPKAPRGAGGRFSRAEVVEVLTRTENETVLTEEVRLKDEPITAVEASQAEKETQMSSDTRAIIDTIRQSRSRKSRYEMTWDGEKSLHTMVSWFRLLVIAFVIGLAVTIFAALYVWRNPNLVRDRFFPSTMEVKVVKIPDLTPVQPKP